MKNNYAYDSIIVITKSGKKYDYDYCDYYIQDNILTVFRETSLKKGYYGNEALYYKFESHFPWDSVENIKCITK